MDNLDLDLDLYIMAELKYKHEHSNEKEENLFPIDWYSSKNYKLKTEIIVEALKNKIKIEETNLYQTKFIESLK